MYQKNNLETTFPLDRKRKKDYTESNQVRLQLGAFDDDAVADAAVNYLYDKGNQSKTQAFLQNNGFPSAQDRAFNKQLYGAQEEQRQMRDLLKNRTYTIMTPTLPNENDRAFLHGLMGEKEGERDYQKQINDANRAQSDLLSTFRDTQFESSLKPSVPKRKALPEFKLETDDTPDANNGLSHTADFDDTKYVRPNFSDSRTVASTSKNIAYGGETISYANNSVNKVASSEPAPKAVRASVENAGGSVNWNSKTNKATIRINGYTEDFYVGDGYGTFIQNGVMYTDKLHLDNMIYAPTETQAKTIYNEITDDFGKFVLRTWFFGDGSEVNVSGERWNGFIKNNSKVQKVFENTVKQNISQGNTSFDVEEEVALSEDGKGGYKSGYELINGSNRTVGGFALKGDISSMGNGKYLVKINYTLNDIIDPDYSKSGDLYYSLGAWLLGVAGKDYTLRISGSVTFIYSNHGGLLKYV